MSWWTRQQNGYRLSVKGVPVHREALYMTLYGILVKGIVDLTRGNDIPFSQLLITLVIGYPIVLLVVVRLRKWAQV